MLFFKDHYGKLFMERMDTAERIIAVYRRGPNG